jgi:hypothetical protein
MHAHRGGYASAAIDSRRPAAGAFSDGLGGALRGLGGALCNASSLSERLISAALAPLAIISRPQLGRELARASHSSA